LGVGIFMTKSAPGNPVLIDIQPTFPVPPLSGLSLQITDACNLACSYCYFYDKDPVAITEDNVDRALDLLAAEANESSPDWHINLFGGEPTLKPDLIRYICAQASNRAQALGKRASFSMTTNGTRFDQRMLDLVTEFQVATMLSIDGNRQAHDQFRKYLDGRGSYDRIMENLGWLMKAPQFKVRLTVSAMTVKYLAESVEELLRLGIRSIASSPVVEDKWTADDISTFASQWQRVGAIYIRERLKGERISIKGLDARDDQEPLAMCAAPADFGCGAATTFLFVNAYGDLYPCHRFPGYFGKSSHVRLGSVASGIDEAKRMHYVLANRASAKKGCRSFVSTTQEKGPCGDCSIQGACGGSCMAINEFITGDPTQPPSLPGALEQIKLAVMSQVYEYMAKCKGAVNS
jgi:uncharacterized protein